MGRVHKLLLWSCLKGVAVGWLLLAIGIYFDVVGVRKIVFDSSDRVLATALLMVGFAITFGNAAMGHAVMKMAGREKAIKERIPK